MKKKYVFLILMMSVILSFGFMASAKQLTSRFEFCRELKCDTLIIIEDGDSISAKINSKKKTWLELQEEKFDVYLYKQTLGPDVIIRRTKAKCIGETSLKWKGLPEGTYYLKFEKARDGQLLEGTVEYKI